MGKICYAITNGGKNLLSINGSSMEKGETMKIILEAAIQIFLIRLMLILWSKIARRNEQAKELLYVFIDGIEEFLESLR